jgi:hypothetical protein
MKTEESVERAYAETFAILRSHWKNLQALVCWKWGTDKAQRPTTGGEGIIAYPRTAESYWLAFGSICSHHCPDPNKQVFKNLPICAGTGDWKAVTGHCHTRIQDLRKPEQVVASDSGTETLRHPASLDKETWNKVTKQILTL